MKCPECATNMRESRGDHVYVESGLDNVVLKDIAIYVCENGHRMPGIPNMKILHEVIAQALLSKPALLSGKEIKYLRKQLRLKAVEFAIILGLTKQHLSRLENGRQAIGQQTDKLIRLAFVRKKEEDSGRIYRMRVMKDILPRIRASKEPFENKLFHATPEQVAQLKNCTGDPDILPWLAEEQMKQLQACNT